MSDQDTRDAYDRIIGELTGLPDHEFTRIAAVSSVLPIIGRQQAYMVQTCRTPSGGYIGFLQFVDSEGRARIAIPTKVMAAIYRQRDQLVKRARRATGKRQYEKRNPQLRSVERGA